MSVEQAEGRKIRRANEPEQLTVQELLQAAKILRLIDDSPVVMEISKVMARIRNGLILRLA